MIGLWLPIVGALAYWLGAASADPPVTPETEGLVNIESEPLSWQAYRPRPLVGAERQNDPLPWHVSAALVSPLSYSYGELKEIVSILDHRGQHDDADRLALVVLSLVPMMQWRSTQTGDRMASLWFYGGSGRFSFGVPPYPPPPPTVW